MYVCIMYVCMYVCLYVSIYVCVCIHSLYIHTGIQKNTHASTMAFCVTRWLFEARLPATLIRGIVRGNFTANGQNHGKPTYKKDDLECGAWDSSIWRALNSYEVANRVLLLAWPRSGNS